VRIKKKRAKIAEAQMALEPTEVDLFVTAQTRWKSLRAKCQQFRCPLPNIESDLMIDNLLGFQANLKNEIDELTFEINFSAEPDQSDAEIVAEEFVETGDIIVRDVSILNPVLIEIIQQAILWQVEARSTNGSAQIHESATGDQTAIIGAVIPNLAVQERVTKVVPATAEEIEKTARQISDTEFTLSADNPNAAIHVLSAIAQTHNLSFAVMPSPPPTVMRDAWRRSAEFSMANDVLCDGSLFLLGSDCPEHHLKGISLHLQGNLNELQRNPIEKQRFLSETKQKLSEIHNVKSSDIVIMAMTQGSIVITYAILNNKCSLANLEQHFQQKFGSCYTKHEIHPSFIQLQINPRTFDPKWNRDYRVSDQCPTNESRGGYPYQPPKGWMRYGMDVAGKYRV
jgi:hypothetical protein